MRNRKMRLSALGWPLLLLLVFGVNEAQSAAPAGRYTVSEQTVIDEVTGLTWQRVVPPQFYTWVHAKSYCENLPLDGGGWRLPSRKELLSIVDIKATTPPAIDATAFPNTPIFVFWSSSAPAGSTNNAWGVNFDYGYTGNLSVSSSYRVRCVR